MTFTQIQYFLSIIEYGSFSAAASEMYISQSSLSKQIKSLETEIETELFYRSNNKISLTPGGKLFFKYAKSLDTTYQKMLQEMAQFEQTGSSQTVNLGTLPLMHEYHIAPRLTVFQETEDAQINIVEANQSQILHLMQTQKLDLAILRLDYLDKELYNFYPIQEDEFVLVCSAKQAKRFKKDTISLSMLDGLPFVLLSNESDITKTCNDYFSKSDFQPNITLTSTRHLYLLSMVDADLGITILPRNLVNVQMFPNIVTLPFEEKISTTIGVAHLKEHTLSAPGELLYHFFSEPLKNEEALR